MSAHWNILGHAWAVDMLRRHIAAGGTRHAYLFTGPAGVGRRTLALRFAQALNCAHPPASGEFCGQCRECRQTAAMTHPDLAVIQAEAEGGVLKVEQVRELKRAVSLKPYQAAYRVGLFLRFEEANPSASNALLKTLEEAPSHVVLLLTAETPEALLPTIVSRCETLRLRPPPIEDVRRELESRGVENNRAELIARLSGGRAGYAFRLAEDPSLLEFRQQKLEELQRLLSASRADKFAYAEQLAKDKDAMRETFLVWESFWRDVFLSASSADAPLANIDRAEEIASLANQLGLAAARRRVRETERALQQLGRNVNARLLAEVLLLGWSR